jgi:hypothetical protein
MQIQRHIDSQPTRHPVERIALAYAHACACVMALTLLMAMSVAGQAAYEPPKGSPERKAILDALRIPVERDLKQKIAFVTGNFKVQGNWAFVDGTPQGANGQAPNYRGTRFYDAFESGAFDNNFYALMKKTRGKWKVTTYAIGCTDVCYTDWWSRYRAPKAIFPYTE